ncbi:DUF1629 domain-containing protein [Stenotrophomonas maltophilia]|uniref:Immunity MXAN-0049 protein domain-containing protein n=1 Tax=Stenotrophomonas maltophilia TaxID=40324 RepID=A0A2W6ISZ0_STEMA|nr:DUF1629 domain-containing protein [Stenotrophomonas maltophilia]PZS98393.1 hypothetical protein A7X83_20020 [Stenotrophomonas maltophilia]
MDSVSTRHPRKGEFFLLEPGAISGPACGVVFENLDRLLSPPRMILLPEDGGVASLREPPRLVLRLSEGPPPGDLESGFSGYWLVSERLHDVMVSVDPHAFTFAEADYRLEDGSRGDRHFLCTVVQVVDALDEGASKLFIDTTEEFINGKFYDLGGGASVTFDRERLGQAHVFRTPFSGSVFCDRVFRDAMAAAGIDTDSDADGVWLTDAADI